MSSKRKRPVSSSKKMQPKDQMSAASEMFQWELLRQCVFHCFARKTGVCRCRRLAGANTLPSIVSFGVATTHLSSVARATRATATGSWCRDFWWRQGRQGTKSNSNISGPWEATESEESERNPRNPKLFFGHRSRMVKVAYKKKKSKASMLLHISTFYDTSMPNCSTIWRALDRLKQCPFYPFLTLMISVPLFLMSSSWAFWREGITITKNLKSPCNTI